MDIISQAYRIVEESLAVGPTILRNKSDDSWGLLLNDRFYSLVYKDGKAVWAAQIWRQSKELVDGKEFWKHLGHYYQFVSYKTFEATTKIDLVDTLQKLEAQLAELSAEDSGERSQPSH